MSSPKGESSSSRKMGRKLVQQLLEKYVDAEVVEYDLSRLEIPHLAENHINAFLSQQSKEQKKTDRILFSPIKHF